MRVVTGVADLEISAGCEMLMGEVVGDNGFGGNG